MHMVKHSRLCGRAIVAYLQSKGFPEVALHFVRDPQTRFRLALACGNIEAAMESAFSLEQQQGTDGKSQDVWGELGSEALRQGNHQVVEMSYQRKKDFDRLSFLYMLTGDSEKLRKMLKISNMRNDIMGRYHNALLLGDAEERVAVLEASGNLPLAYISAKLHGLEDVAERIKVAVETQEGSVEGLSKFWLSFVCSMNYCSDSNPVDSPQLKSPQWTRYLLAQKPAAVCFNPLHPLFVLVTGQLLRLRRPPLRTCQLLMQVTSMRKKKPHLSLQTRQVLLRRVWGL